MQKIFHKKDKDANKLEKHGEICQFHKGLAVISNPVQKSKMASRKGVAVTVAVLAAVTGGSFFVWLAPEQADNQATFVVSDYAGYLDGARNIHEVLQESVEIDYQRLRDGSMAPEEYRVATEAVSSQMTSQISEFVTSKPPEEWQTSYIGHMEAMKKYNEYVRETVVLATMIQEDRSEEEIAEMVERIDAIKKESAELAEAAEDARPDRQ